MVNNQKILLKFIKTNDNVNWGYISIYQKLSENFIREFENKVVWHRISEYQTLSENFIREFKYKFIYD